MGTRWYVPVPSAKAIRRSRLEGAVAHSDWDLLVVHAPGGSGKSTFVAQVVRTAPFDDVDVIWFTLGSDSAGAGFWEQLDECLRATGIPATGIDVARLITYGAGPWLGRALTTALADRGGLVIVLDDFHLAQATEAEERTLTLLASMSATLRLVVISRSLAYLAGARDVSDVEALVIDQSDLAFSLEEASRFGRQSEMISPAEARLAELVAATRGSPMAIGLAVDVSRRTGTTLALIDDDQWGSTAMRARTSEELTVLGCLALAESLTRQVVSAATDMRPEDANAALHDLQLEGIVVESDDRVRLHPTLRTAMRVDFARRAPEAFGRAARVVIHSLIEGGAGVAALHLALESRDWNLANAVCGVVGISLIADPSSFVSLVKEVPAAAFRGRGPLLVIALLATAIQEETQFPALMAASWRVIGDRLRAGSDGVTSTDRLLTDVMAQIARNIVGLASSRRVLEMSYERLREQTLDAYLAAPGMNDFVRESLAWSLAGCGEVEKAHRVIDRLAVDCRARNDHWAVVRTTMLSARTYAVEGDAVRARARLETLGPMDGQVPAKHAFTLVNGQLAQAIIDLDQLRPQRADEIAARIENDHPAMVQASLVTYVRARAALVSASRAERIRALMHSHARPRGPYRYFSTLARVAVADLLISLGEFDRVERGLMRVRAESAAAVFARARIAQLRGDHHGSLLLSERALMSGASSPRMRIEGLALGATALLSLGKPERAALKVREAEEWMLATAAEAPLARIPGEWRPQIARMLTDEPLRRRLLAADLADPFGGGAPSAARPSARELAVLELMGSDATLGEIGALLGTSVNTVKRQAASLYRKLGVASRGEALEVARVRGILKPQVETVNPGR